VTGTSERARDLLGRLLPRGAAILAALIFVSYALGLVRDRLFAGTFGAGPELDAYNAAFVLPELLLDVLVEAGLAAPFIPIFLRLRAGDDAGEGDRFARTILSGAVAIMGVASLIMLVFAEATVGVIAPGFRDGQRELYLGLFRTMLLTQVAFAASLTLGQVLLAEQRYFWYGVAPLLYNLGIIVGTVVFAPSLGIYGPAVGAVIGAGIHLGSRFIGLRGSSFHPGLGWGARRDALREFVRLMLPKAVSQPVEPITFGFFTAVASSMAAGGITAFNFARNFQSLPVSLVGVAFAVAVFPALARAHAEGDRGAFRRLVLLTALRIVVVTIAAAVVMAVFGELGIGILLGGGSFDAADVALTGSLLAAFAVSVPFESLNHLLSRAIYATRHTVLQVLASLAGLVVTILATLALVDAVGIVGLPLGFGIGQASKTALLALALGVRMRSWRAALRAPEVSSA
jgi:putative peptidoglycan lipid II flippase